jgi:hypothetical protein
MTRRGTSHSEEGGGNGEGGGTSVEGGGGIIGIGIGCFLVAGVGGVLSGVTIIDNFLGVNGIVLNEADLIFVSLTFGVEGAADFTGFTVVIVGGAVGTKGKVVSGDKGEEGKGKLHVKRKVYFI